MQKTRLHARINTAIDRSYHIDVGSYSFVELADIVAGAHEAQCYCIISDSVVDPLAGRSLHATMESKGHAVVSLTVPAGERSKSLIQVEKLIDQMRTNGLGRDTCIVALGGGVVGDLAGFVAGCYMRGIPFVQVPTTLLALVDSSVGGKTGVNVGAGKNYCGLFNQPRHVVANIEFLSFLPDSEFQNGMAEVIKYGVIIDSQLFDLLEDNSARIVARDQDVLHEIVVRSCKAKSDVVERDECESGLRRILNYGHTVGHAMEEAAEYRVAHGMCVACGMRVIAHIAVQMGVLSSEDSQRQSALLDAFGLHIPDEIRGLDIDSIERLLTSDKKRQADRMVYVLPERIGTVAVRDDIPHSLVREALEYFVDSEN